jgi:DUF1009 family protein
MMLGGFTGFCELAFEGLSGDDEMVKLVGHLAGHASPTERHPGREVAAPGLGQDLKQDVGIKRICEAHC